MILYLLVPVLIFGAVESQTANMTNALRTDEMHKVERNQTFNVSTLDNSTMKPSNVTSGLYEDMESRIEDELKNNRTSVITEDNEDFQDHEDKLPRQHCHQQELIEYSQILCVEPFLSKMQEIGTENWCVMESIIRPYNEMTLCMEYMSNMCSCYYPNKAIQDLFLQVHSNCFQNCTKEEFLFEDAPQWLVITLTLIPVSLIPVLTYMVVWKSKVQE